MQSPLFLQSHIFFIITKIVTDVALVEIWAMQSTKLGSATLLQLMVELHKSVGWVVLNLSTYWASDELPFRPGHWWSSDP